MAMGSMPYIIPVWPFPNRKFPIIPVTKHRLAFAPTVRVPWFMYPYDIIVREINYVIIYIIARVHDDGRREIN